MSSKRNKPNEYELIGNPIVRSASEPVENYPSCLSDSNVEALQQILSRCSTSFLDSIEIASKDLSRSITNFSTYNVNKQNKVLRGLLKYTIRSSFRPTPFGGFAEIGRLTSHNIDTNEKLILTRTNDRFTLRLASNSNRLKLNPSIYTIDGRLFIPTPSPNGDLSSVRFTTPVSDVIRILGNGELTIEQIVSTLEQLYQVPSNTLQDFITGLINTGVLLHEQVTPKFVTIPRKASAQIKNYQNYQPIVNSFADYNGQIPSWIIQNAGEALTVLGNMFGEASKAPAISDYVAKYEERFGAFREPLPYVLDRYTGIDVPNFDNKNSSDAAVNKTISTTKKILAETIQLAYTSGDYSIDLAQIKPELNSINTHNTQFASSYEAILHLEVAKNPNRFTLVLDPIGAIIHAGRGIARFVPYDPTIKSVHEQLVEFDIHHSPATLCGLSYRYSSSKANAVNGDASVYPLHLNMNTPDNHRESIHLEDISIFVQGGKIHLYDERDQTLIEIRDAGAVNPDLGNSWAKFLSYQSNYGIATPFWDWMDFSDYFVHLPEIRWKQVVLTREQWLINKQVSDALGLKRWLSENKIPQYVLIGTADNQLLIDTQNPRHQDLLLREIKVGSRRIFRSAQPMQYGICTNQQNEHFSTELQLAITCDAWQKSQNSQYQVPPKGDSLDYTEHFNGIEPWTNIILYCSPEIIERTISSLTKFLNNRLVDFYFIRYNDKGSSIRLRLKNNPNSEFQTQQMPLINELTASLLVDRLITDFSIQPWHPEYSRYSGRQGFILASEMFIEDTRWIWTDSSWTKEIRQNHVYRFANTITSQLFTNEIVEMIAVGFEQEFREERNKIRAQARILEEKIMDETDKNFLIGSHNLQKLYLRHFHQFKDISAIQSSLHMLFNRTGFTRKDEAIYYRALSNHRKHEEYQHDQ
ncbi:thiopeptide-type bacteriocin biosynthesis protein [Bifidobacterium sp. ESL0798]|uniref:thiopeptide-type bacteriocin biosynthesis protein n=1 Tax=Bifidobacterium sp. ESL0798 TaxID=2983235 RepID=UPI0023F83219|nr:thiopeptide-type bacteriocin biosynthesis protein [Bifidobacterium sp. ESL0798]WEV73477.1 thiopeptide-type bacteriocin biosynthesis protein [Bifidobacterium sp. ESL0798]